MIYLITNIKYDEGHDELPKNLAMSVRHKLNEDDLEDKASEFISEQTGFCHKGFSVEAFELHKGKSYTYSTDPSELVYMGECDISDQYEFAEASDTENICMSLEGHDLHLLKPFVRPATSL